MDPNSATLQLPKDLIEAAVQQHVSLAVASAFSDKSALLDKFIERVLFQKVDSNGNTSQYSSDNKHAWIDVMIRRSVEQKVQAIIAVELEQHSDRISKTISTQLSRQNSPLLKSLADSMVNGFAEAAKSKYRLTVSIDSER